MVHEGLRHPKTVRKMMNSAKGAIEAKTVKNQLVSIGYDNATSFYGVLHDIGTGKVEYRRIEVLSDTPLEERQVELLYRFFQKNKPVKTYSIWVYDSKKDSVKLLWECW